MVILMIMIMVMMMTADPGYVLVDNPVTNQREIVVTGYYGDLDDHDHGDDDDRRSRLCSC